MPSSELLDEGATVLDLGSGGGVPGLVLVVERPDLSVTMLDANKRRTDFLDEALMTLGAGDRANVIRARAEEAGRNALLRGAFDQVVSRSFGPPAVVAECAAPVPPRRRAARRERTEGCRRRAPMGPERAVDRRHVVGFHGPTRAGDRCR